MANWSNNFPSWGDTGEQPPTNKNYGAEQVNEKHFDYLWDQLNKTFDEILSHTIQDDGSVTMDADLDLGGNGLINVGTGGITSHSDAVIQFGGNSISLIPDAGGLVHVSGSDLDMNGGNIRDINEIQHDGSNSKFDFLGNGSLELHVDNGVGGFTTALTVDNGTSPNVTVNNGNLVTDSGNVVTNFSVEFGTSGARIFIDANGELIAEDDAGNQTQLT